MAIEEYNTVISSEVRHFATVSELVPQYQHWLFFFVLFAFNECCRQRGFHGVSAEHVMTLQTVVEANILKHYIFAVEISCVYISAKVCEGEF